MPRFLAELIESAGGLTRHGIDPGDVHTDEFRRTCLISDISADSREIREGALFAALQGISTHGAVFIPQAIAAGAKVILTDAVSGLDLDIDRNWDGCFLRCNDPARLWSEICAAWFAPLPESMVGVTGTNGKSSTVTYARQLWAMSSHDAASIGTLGVEIQSAGARVQSASSVLMPGALSSNMGMTTADPRSLAQTLSVLQREGITHVALEASSHGLDQRRLDGIRFRAAAMVGIGRDHLDYHKTFERYVAAKARLFSDLLVDSGVAIICAAAPRAEDFIWAAKSSGHTVWLVGGKEQLSQLKDYDGVMEYSVCSTAASTGTGFVYQIHVRWEGTLYVANTQLAVDYQISNALCAAALCIACGSRAGDVFALLEKVRPPVGRMDVVGHASSGARILIDYAHTPDALLASLSELRTRTSERLHVVFGAGGERDQGKRPEMGRVCSGLADVIWLCDDNPRSEDPHAIRKEIASGICMHNSARAVHCYDIGDRRQAIENAISNSGNGDTILIAGKGHETVQVVGDMELPFSDYQVVAKALAHGE